MAEGVDEQGEGPTERLDVRLERLEQIVERLDSTDIELEDALRLFEEGIRHLRSAQEVIRGSELRIEELLDDEEGGAAARPIGGIE